jgi:hypothetical protein
MELLRSTNRLSTYLASQGYAARRGNHAVAEAEFVSLSGSTAKSANPFSFPCGLDFDMLRSVMAQTYIGNECRAAFSVGKLRYVRRFLPHFHFTNRLTQHTFANSNKRDTSRFLSDGEKVDVLWISAEVFVTSQYHIGGSWNLFGEHLYSITVTLHQHRLELHAHSRRSEVPQHYMSETPLRFFCHFLTPILHLGPSVVVCFVDNRSEPPIDAFLALIPTTDQCITNDVTICFFRPSRGHMQVLASHPVHRRVCLCLEIGYLFRYSREEMNQYLLGFRQPVHLRIPRILNGFFYNEVPFVENPALVSLTIESGGLLETELSKKMIDGIAKNTNIKSLLIDCDDWGTYTDFGRQVPCWVIELLRDAVLTSSSLECLLFAVNRNRDYEPRSSACKQAAFDHLTSELVSRIRVWDCDKRRYSVRPAHQVHSVSKFQVRSQRPLKSNACWDSVLFSPALVLNCLHRLQGGSPPGNTAALAVLRINQGILYSFATNLIPCDLSVSSASTTFYVLRSGLFKHRCASTRNATDTAQVM